MTETKKIGRYIVESLLGEGAMGSVFKAVDPFIKRTVAIKTVKLDLSRGEEDSQEFYDRFILEAQISGRLHHPNIVSIFDVGDQEGMPYIAMEYVRGKTLNEFCQRIPRPGQSTLLKILMQIAAALDFAHGKGVIHRDLKPSNIMVMNDGAAKIMDFGIAKMSGSNLTQTGVFLGTPSYSSPEQIKEGSVDFRSDIFSFGILCHETLTGFLPFPGQSINAILYKIANEPPTFAPNLKDLPLDAYQWRQVFDRVLHKNPDKRYQTASSLIEALMGCLRLSDEDKTLVGKLQSEITATIREPRIRLPEVNKDLKRSDFERAQANTQTVVSPVAKQKNRPFISPILLLLLVISASIAFTWYTGYLEQGLAYLTREKEPEPIAIVEPPTAAPIIKALRFDSEPTGALIEIEGGEISPAPRSYVWEGQPQARLRVTWRLDGYQEKIQTLTLTENLKEIHAVKLTPIPVSRTLDSLPDQASVAIDGEKIGNAPLTHAFISGQTYALVFSKSGYYDSKFKYKEGEDEPSALSVKLKPIPLGTLSVVTTMEDLRIAAAGKTVQDADLELLPGVYDVVLSSKTYFYSQSFSGVAIKSNETVTLTTPPIINIPKIEFIGAYVKVKIDGQFVKKGKEVDTTPMVDLMIVAGKHQFEFIDPDDKILVQKTIEVVKSEAIVQTIDPNPGN